MSSPLVALDLVAARYKVKASVDQRRPERPHYEFIREAIERELAARRKPKPKSKSTRT
jgi:hypothetical protein